MSQEASGEEKPLDSRPLLSVHIYLGLISKTHGHLFFIKVFLRILKLVSAT